MTSRLNPYLNFRGTAAQAMEFYHSVFGGELTLTRFADMPGMPGIGADEHDLVMHGQLVVSDSVTLMGADVPASMELTLGTSITVSLSGADEDELTGWWSGLGEGGEITMPLAKAPWGDSFGELTDRFGVRWLINISGS